MENNWPFMHSKMFHAAQGNTIVQKLSNNKLLIVLKWFVGLIDLEHRTARDRKAIWALKSYHPPMHLIK